jgi:methyltransferase
VPTPSLQPYDALVALVAVQRLFELRLSRRNEGIAFARGAVEAGRAHFGSMKAMHTLFLVSCVLEAHLCESTLSPAARWVALGALLVAQGIRYWAIRTLGPRWSVRILVWPDASPIQNGPYRYLRHPNYLAVVLEIAALPLVAGAYRTAILFSVANAIVLTVRIRAEENALGPGYAAAFGETPRLLPRRSADR